MKVLMVSDVFDMQLQTELAFNAEGTYELIDEIYFEIWHLYTLGMVPLVTPIQRKGEVTLVQNRWPHLSHAIINLSSSYLVLQTQ